MLYRADQQLDDVAEIWVVDPAIPAAPVRINGDLNGVGDVLDDYDWASAQTP